MWVPCVAHATGERLRVIRGVKMEGGWFCRLREKRGRFLKWVAAALVIWLMPLTAQADFEKIRIAVLDFQLQGQGYETEDMGAIVAEWFITALVKAGRFDVVERAMLKKIINEQKLGMTGVIDESSATQLGKILGVKVIISGSVLKLQDVLEVNARIIDVKTGSIIAAENVKSISSTNLQQLIVLMSEKIIKNFPLECYVVKRSGKTVTIDLGRIAGVKTDMEFIVFKEGDVIKHPKTGEVLDVTRIQIGRFKITHVQNKIAEGIIIKEEKSDAIAYGQMVKSVAGPLKPESKEVVIRPPRKKISPVATSRPYVSKPPVRQKVKNDVLNKLRSNNLKNKIYVAKTVIRSGTEDQVVLDAIEEELLKGYRIKSSSRNHVDAMSWLCKALGATAKPKYQATLKKVAKDAPSRKLRGYAAKALNNY